MGYLAALVDREGMVSLATYSEYWRVKVSNTNTEIIDWLATIGGTTSRQAQGRNRKDMWLWNLANQEEVYDLLSAVLPYLKTSTKRDEALEAITAISTKGAPPLRPGRGRLLKRRET